MDYYVVVEVTYDWYRFQENLGVANSWLYAMDICNKYRDKADEIWNVYEYEEYDEIYQSLDNHETQHLRIEKHKLNGEV